MALFDTILEPPRYPVVDAQGEFIRPSRRQIWSEFFFRLNAFRDRRNWLPLMGWVATCSLAVPLLLFVRFDFSLPLLAVGLVYAMVLMGTHGTIYLHRYSTHRAFQISHPLWRFVLRNATIKIVPEEIYVVSHHVHHRYPEQAPDPYNVNGGWLYCFLADVNHQPIARGLSEVEYARVAALLSHTGVKANTHAQYLRWGSIAHPAHTALHYLLNWAFWWGAFTLIGGPRLALAIFGIAALWAFGIRTFNYNGHGRGKDRRRDGIDFNRSDLSVNQVWPGFVAGEWHNNHHLYPSSARTGFLPYQLDLAWLGIRVAHALGMVSSFRDDRAAFLMHHQRSPDPLAVPQEPPRNPTEAPPGH